MKDNEGVAAARPRAVGSAMFWRVFAVINLVTVLWVMWLIWQLSPKPVVNEFVMRLPVSQRTSLGAIGPLPAQERIPAPAPPAEIPIQSGEPMRALKMDMEIRTPVKK